MLLREFRDLLLGVDSKASHYESKQKGNYTVWAEYGQNILKADDAVAESADKIQIDRFTKIEYDPVADAIKTMLNEQCIVFEYHVDYEEVTGYIHHIYDCEVD